VAKLKKKRVLAKPKGFREPTPEEMEWEEGVFTDEIRILLLEILKRATDDLLYSSTEGRVGDGIFKESDRESAAEWMLSDSEDDVFDFLRITDVLGINPKELRTLYKAELKRARNKQTSFI